MLKTGCATSWISLKRMNQLLAPENYSSPILLSTRSVTGLCSQDSRPTSSSSVTRKLSMMPFARSGAFTQKWFSPAVNRSFTISSKPV